MRGNNQSYMTVKEIKENYSKPIINLALEILTGGVGNDDERRHSTVSS